MIKKKNNFWMILIIHIIIIIILLILIVKIKIDGDVYNCEKCQIEFYEEKGYQPELMRKENFKINLTTLYLGYTLDKCPLTWDDNQGYMGLGYSSEVSCNG